MLVEAMKRSLLPVAAFALLVGGCGGSSDTAVPVVAAISPAVAAEGEEVILYGSGFDHGAAPTVTFDGIDFVNVVSYTGNRVHVLIPVGAVSGELRVQAGVSVSDPISYSVGTRTPVTEAEPNEDNATATAATTNRVCNGSLSATTDVDTYSFTFLAGTHYRLKVDPVLTGVTVSVNGAAVALDSNGQVDVSSSSATEHISLTGATGSYTLTLTAID